MSGTNSFERTHAILCCTIETLERTLNSARRLCATFNDNSRAQLFESIPCDVSLCETLRLDRHDMSQAHDASRDLEETIKTMHERARICRMMTIPDELYYDDDDSTMEDPDEEYTLDSDTEDK